MLNIQTYLSNHTLEDLKTELDIDIREYPDLVVLNYGIKSPKFHPVCDECRALILEKGTWKVLARSFQRFYNYEEGESYKTFPIKQSVCLEKLDGTLISMWWYKDHWEVSTRSMAFAEGPTSMGIGTFKDLWLKAIKDNECLGKIFHNNIQDPNKTWVFELTGPENRIVTRYSETKVTMIGIRDNITGAEATLLQLKTTAKIFNVPTPKEYPCPSFEEVVEKANSLDTLDEGFVLLSEADGSHKRIKVKNSRYLAVAHIRDNGKISAKRILTLILTGNAEEFIGYFPEYKPYCDFIEKEWNDYLNTVKTIWEETKHIENQKEFALTIQAKTKGLALGCLFSMKKGKSLKEATNLETIKIYKGLNLKDKFEKYFKIKTEGEEDEA